MERAERRMVVVIVVGVAGGMSGIEVEEPRFFVVEVRQAADALEAHVTRDRRIENPS